MNSPYSNNSKEMTIENGCPWYEAQQAYGAPNVNWCEPTFCSTINEPANTWSNLGYILVGIVLIRKMKSDPIANFPYAVIAMGALSFIYHATNNYLSQFFDFIGMFLMLSFLIAFSVQRVFVSAKLNFYTVYWFLMFLNTMIFMIFDIMNLPVQEIMLLNILPIVIFDLTAGYKEKRLHDYKYFFTALLLMGVAQGFAIVDIKRIWCNPENVFLHGHVLWHLIGSIGMLFAGFHLHRIQTKRCP